MKNLAMLSAAASMLIAGLPLFAETVPATSQKSVSQATAQREISMLVFIRDVAGAFPRETCGNVAAAVSAAFTLPGITPLTPDFLGTSGNGGISFEKLSPAEIADLAGADYTLEIRLAAPLETARNGTIYARHGAYYALISPTGTALAAGRVSKIFDAPETNGALREIRAVEIAEAAADELAEKIAGGEIALQAAAAYCGEIEISCALEAPAFPYISENADGTFTISDVPAKISVPGVSLKIGGLGYHLAADGSPTRLKLPLGRALRVSVSHRDIVPETRIVRLTAGEKITFSLALTPEAKKRWLADFAAMNAIVSEAKNAATARNAVAVLTAAEAEKLRGIAKFWENSGIKITQTASQNFSREVKITERETVGDVPENASETK